MPLYLLMYNGIQDMYIYLIDFNYNNWFYIGKTSNPLNERYSSHNSSRRKNKSLTHKVWNKAIEEGNVPEIILLEKTNEENLNDLEIWYIAYFKSIGGKLTNLTEGGDGLHGLVFSQEHREKISKNKIGKYKPTSDHIESIKKANSGPRSEDFKTKIKQIRTGTKHSEETKTKIRQSNIGKHIGKGTVGKIQQIDKMTRQVIKVWNSITEASYALYSDKVHNAQINIEAAANPKCNQKTAYGFIWKYL